MTGHGRTVSHEEGERKHVKHFQNISVTFMDMKSNLLTVSA